MHFPSKHDFWLGLLIWGIIILATIPSLVQPSKVGMGVMILAILFVGWIWFGTGYEILEKELKIYSGPFRQTISLQEIKEIKRTRNPSSSPACSLDRMEVKFGQSKRIIISPADKENFIKVIVKKSPQIQLDESLKQYV
jgi:hypothetical protein